MRPSTKGAQSLIHRSTLFIHKLQLIKRADRPGIVAAQYVSVYLGSLHIVMPQQFLHGPDICSCL